MPNLSRQAAACCVTLCAVLLIASGAMAQTQNEIDSALELYRYRLLQSGMRLRAYPEEAQRRHLEGTAQFNLVVAANGSLREVTLLASSGHPELDGHGLALLSRAVPLTEIPSTLHNKAFAVRVVIDFKLPD